MLPLRKFAAGIGRDQPLCGIQALIDSEIEAGGVGGVPEIATQCLAALREAQPDGPYILVGHSIGGHVAYEMAARLQSAGQEVLLLGLLDPAGPHTLRWAGRTRARVLELTGLGAEPRREGAHRVALSAFKNRIVWRLCRDRGTVSENGSQARPSV